MPVGYSDVKNREFAFHGMPKIAPPPGLSGLFLDPGCETPKGGAYYGNIGTPSTAAPTPSTTVGSSSLPPTPLMASGAENPFLLPFPGLFPDLPAGGNPWGFNADLLDPKNNPFLQNDFNSELLNCNTSNGMPQDWMTDPAVAAAAAAALWMGAEAGGFNMPIPVDDTTPPGSVSAYPSKSVPWTWEARPKLRDLRALPSKGLGLHYNQGQFGVVSLPDARPPTGPAATVVRPSEKFGMVFPRQLPEVSWAVKDWVATRTMRAPNQDLWVTTETVPLARTADASQEEWERRFCQREKQVMVGKGTRGYQQYVQMIPKEKRSARDPSTPRVAEQCSKRAFDGRLKQWRILLHAFSPRGSPENSPRTSTRESTAGGEEDRDQRVLPMVWDKNSAKARVALECANLPEHLQVELQKVFCSDHDGVQHWFGQPEFEFELAKRAHAYLSAEKTATFGVSLAAVSSVLEELRKTNTSLCRSP